MRIALTGKSLSWLSVIFAVILYMKSRMLATLMGWQRIGLSDLNSAIASSKRFSRVIVTISSLFRIISSPFESQFSESIISSFQLLRFGAILLKWRQNKSAWSCYFDSLYQSSAESCTPWWHRFFNILNDTIVKLGGELFPNVIPMIGRNDQ
jgi:hypothetical protein